MIEKSQIERVVKSHIDRYLHKDLIDADVLKSIDIIEDVVNLKLRFGFPVATYAGEIQAELSEKLQQIDGLKKINFDIGSKIIPHAVQKSLQHLPEVKNIIVIASGKGGVGKSTTAANLALALQAEGATVGLLDADIYGPSQTKMMGMTDRPQSNADGKIEPLQPYGVQAMSIGLMIDEETPMVWRGPMVTQALQQLLNDTAWKGIDYLVIDLPPGTGDIQLTLSQHIPVAGAVIVTTPQDIALLDARKALKMFEKVEVPVIGIVENMSTHICSNCGHAESIFGEGGGQQMAKDYNVELLGALPLDIKIRQQVDSGSPTVVSEPDGEIAAIYSEIARKVAAKLSLRSKDYASVFPKIVIENN
jgi:ATP-binding protein involved in chromosome partitioning